MEIDPDLADTADFCARYDVPLDNSANAILVASKKVEPTVYALGLVLSTDRLDVNKRMRKLMGVRRCSFATAEQMNELTGMIVGGVTPFALPEGLPIYVDARVMERPWVVVGGGGRDTKIKVEPKVFETIEEVEVVEGLGLPSD
jgi:prolyl-tRNA editing enzyme YbaK/EbsC (Cys-tRNA(Pro) deacylase)